MGCERTGVPITFADRQDFGPLYSLSSCGTTDFSGARLPISYSSCWWNARLCQSRPNGSFFDLFPLSVLTLSSLEQISELEPESRFDARRFRMNIIVGTSAASIR
jgi:hypothetical protein